MSVSLESRSPQRQTDIPPMEKNAKQNPPRKRPLEHSRPRKSETGPRKQRKAASTRPEGSHDEILAFELRTWFPNSSASTTKLPEPFTEIEVTISHLSSTGDGIGTYALDDGTAIVAVVPFSVPGDTVLAKTIRHSKSPQPPHTFADFVKVLQPAPNRDDSLIKCRYFASCGGCQLQMLPYDDQLSHKRSIVERAYANFSHLPSSSLPPILPTMASPQTYAYRTKLTPHFDGPQGGRSAARRGETPRFTEVPPIGFLRKGTRRTLDIEECPIATTTVQAGLTRERARVAATLSNFRKGATILLRESTEVNGTKSCISDNRGTSRELIDSFVFENPANAFFQNNNSILSPFTQYIREHVRGSNPQSIKNLIDAYSGSGLFTITLHSIFAHSIGIDISPESIAFARRNAKLNGVAATSTTPPKSPSSHEKQPQKRNVEFLAGDANELFAAVPSSFHPSETAVILDPPRKGCDEGFLRQLVKFGPARIVYVSCNVHTQARDVGWILRNARTDSTDKVERGDEGDVEKEGMEEESVDSLYSIESLRGFDFFPQTGHVEGVAILQRKE